MDRRQALEILGISSVSVPDDVRTARRQAARTQHPDAGGDTERMSLINQAADLLLDELGAGSSSDVGDASRFRRRNQGYGTGDQWQRGDWSGIEIDRPSFVIDVLPVDAFEWLAMAARVLGQVVDDDPPYCLEVLIDSLPDRWCRLDIVPDAGSSTVSITTSGHDPSDLVPLFVGAINELAASGGVRGEVPPPS
jgi:hypothetical protein